MIKFYWKAVRVAFTHSLERADLLGGILAVVGGALAYFLPGLSEALGLGAWAIPLVFFIVLVAVRLVLAPFWIVREVENSREELESDLQQLRAPQPAIRFVKARKAPMFRPSPVVDTKVSAGEMIQAWFENRPRIPSDGSVARQISTIVEFYEHGSADLLFQVHGQWAESTATDHVGYSGTTPTLDLGPGALYAKLLIALKYPADASAYAYSAESMHSHIDGRNVNLELPPGTYELTIAVRGVNVDEEFRLILVNPGSGGSPDLSLASPDGASG